MAAKTWQGPILGILGCRGGPGVNLGPLNELKRLINEVLASDPDRSYLRKEDRISQLAASKDVHKSAAIATFQSNNENKSRFPKSFWSENQLTVYNIHIYTVRAPL